VVAARYLEFTDLDAHDVVAHQQMVDAHEGWQHLIRRPDGHELVVRGVCAGTIAAAECGDRGFGLDPLFIPADGDGRTFSEMSDTEKNDLSHRGRGFRELVRVLREQRPPQ